MQGEEAPSWLNEGSDVPLSQNAAPPSETMKAANTPKSFSLDEAGEIKDGAGITSPAGSMLQSSGAAEPAPSELQDEADLPKVVLLMRLANLAAAGALIAVSIVIMVSLPPISTWVLSVYATCGGILVCCLETQLKFLRVAIALNFGFLFSAPLRFLFYLLMAAISWTYGRVFGPAVAIAIVAVALFNTYVLCRYPTYRKVREKIAEEEDKRIEAKISGEVKKQAMRSMTG